MYYESIRYTDGSSYTHYSNGQEFHTAPKSNPLIDVSMPSSIKRRLRAMV